MVWQHLGVTFVLMDFRVIVLNDPRPRILIDRVGCGDEVRKSSNNLKLSFSVIATLNCNHTIKTLA